MKDGGPAFPSLCEIHGPARIDSGMSLRDYFAAKAMQGMLAGILADGSSITSEGFQKCAAATFEMADAMLAEREK